MIKTTEEFIPTRRSLLTRLKEWDDQESWQQFFDTYWRLIYSVALKSGGAAAIVKTIATLVQSAEGRELIRDLQIIVSAMMQQAASMDPWEFRLLQNLQGALNHVLF